MHVIRRRLTVAAGIVAAVILLAACEALEQPRTPPDDYVTPELTPPDSDLAALEHEVEDRINDLRAEHGESALERNDTLAAVAREYSCRMAEEGFFAHEGPGGDAVDDRILDAGIRFRHVGENLAHLGSVANPGQAAVEGWMESEGHRQNLLRGDYTETGVGICRGDDGLYFTQIFLRPP